MIAVLNIKNAERKNGLKALTNLFVRSKISVELRQAADIQLMYVKYITKNGRINLDKLNKIVGNQRSRILCCNNISFPNESGFIKFNSNALRTRLCTNMAYGIISSIPNAVKLNIGIYDLNAEISDFLMLALECCKNVTVVTNEYETYRCRLDMALDEMGATAIVTNRPEDLSECDLVIASGEITESLPVKNNTVILASAKPKARQNGTVYYKYYFKIPEIIEKIKPEELDTEYFCSALYSLEGMHSLGSVMPYLCTGNNCSQTLKSMSAIIDKQ